MEKAEVNLCKGCEQIGSLVYNGDVAWSQCGGYVYIVMDCVQCGRQTKETYLLINQEIINEQ